MQINNFTFKDKTLLITGGTGSLGRAITHKVLNTWPEVKKIIIYSRDEQKQYNMALDYPIETYPQIRFFIGDVRDFDRLNRACEDVDYIIHSAAMKHVPIAEYNPDECVKTNIGGAENVIKASLANHVKSVVALSTDKACAPVNLYGATKLTSDKLFISANNIKGNRDLKFSVVRYGNVMGSNGSVIPYYLKKKKEGFLPITHPEMTRFNISLEDGVNMVLYALKSSWGGELFVPKIPSYKILDVAKAIDTKCKIKIVGIRPGEKIHEEMISPSDSYFCYDIGNYFVLLPPTLNWDLNDFIDFFKATKVKPNFHYHSGNNTEWLNSSDLKKLINKINL